MIGVIALAAGLAAGLLAGFMLGREDRSRCRECLSSQTSAYADGFDAGWRDGAESLADRVRERHMDTSGRIWMDRWDLERIEQDMHEAIGEKP